MLSLISGWDKLYIILDWGRVGTLFLVIAITVLYFLISLFVKQIRSYTVLLWLAGLSMLLGLIQDLRYGLLDFGIIFCVIGIAAGIAGLVIGWIFFEWHQKRIRTPSEEEKIESFS